MPKPSRSPFYFYAYDYQRYCQNVNKQKITINDAIAACYDNWKALSEEEKQPYKIRHEQWRMEYRGNTEPVTVTKKTNDEILRKRDIPSEELQDHYDRYSFERDFLGFKYLPLDINELLYMPIYIINFQIFCKIDDEDGGDYIPAEMCILRYTLMEGVTIYRQKFIKPDKIPSGYMSSCLEHLKETHEIPLKDFAEATNNYKIIYQELKSFLFPTLINKSNHAMDNDDRTRRRYIRLNQPCVFFPAVEYEQTKKLIDWLQEKAEGIKPTNDTRLVNLASIESLIMLLGELKKHRVSRDDIHKTFENAAYSFMIEQRCPYHLQLGISHCSVARCHAGAKLISAYLNQLYVPERPESAKHNQPSMNNVSNHVQQPVGIRPTLVSQKSIPSQYSSTDTNDSMASSYQRKSHEQITKLQQQNFKRLISNAESTCSKDDYLSEYTIEDNNQRSVLTQRKQILLQALQSIDQQIEELDIQ